MKKILSLMLALMMLVLTLAACSSEEEKKNELQGVSGADDVVTYTPAENNPFGDSFAYESYEGDKIIITGFVGVSQNHAVNIPASINNFPVVAIGKGAFQNQTSISEVVIPEGVKLIDDFAFAKCIEMQKITVPASVETVGVSAFMECINLLSFEMAGPDEGAVTIGTGAFYKCTSLASVKLPKKLKEIQANTFMDCANLTTVTFGEAVGKIGELAFSGCAKLNMTAIPASVYEIGNYAFSNCNPAIVEQLKTSISGEVKLGGSLDEIFANTAA